MAEQQQPQGTGTTALLVAGVTKIIVAFIVSHALYMLMASQLPPWSAALLKDWGWDSLALIIIVVAVWYYLPKDTIIRRTESAQVQAAANALIAQSLQNIAGAGGLLEKQTAQLAIVVTNQGVIVTRMGELKADHVRTDNILEGREHLFREIALLLGELLELQRNPLAPQTGTGEKRAQGVFLDNGELDLLEKIKNEEE